MNNITTAYLGSIEYYRRLLRIGAAFDLSVPYTRQGGMNRCQIDSPDVALMLSVPVVKPHGRTPVGEILISEHGNWRHQHWNALVSSYRQTPYFDYYEDDFRPFYTEHNWLRLVDFNNDLHMKIMELIGIPEFPDLRISGIPEISSSRDPQIPNSPNMEFRPYYQVFAHKHGFLPNLSIIDLLFNMGPESIYWLI